MGHRVCSDGDLRPGEKRAFTVGSRRIVVARTGAGRLCALADVCPHQGARLSDGYLSDEFVAPEVGRPRAVRSKEVIRCPWHNFAFDVLTGRSLLEPERYRVKTYPVEVVDGDVVVELGRGRGEERR
jgi:nitrite reductase/ring-hydroxylating ferredoxin subunit